MRKNQSESSKAFDRAVELVRTQAVQQPLYRFADGENKLIAVTTIQRAIDIFKLHSDAVNRIIRDTKVGEVELYHKNSQFRLPIRVTDIPMTVSDLEETITYVRQQQPARKEEKK